MDSTGAPKPDNENSPDIAYLGRPAASWKTFLTKLDAGLGIVTSTAATAMGAAVFMGRKKVPEGIAHEIERELGISTEKYMKGYGIGFMAAGGVGLLTSAVAWSTASAADRARNYVHLAHELDGKGSAQQR